MFTAERKLQICVIPSCITGDELIIVDARRQMHRSLLNYCISFGMCLTFSLTPKGPNINSCVCILT